MKTLSIGWITSDFLFIILFCDSSSLQIYIQFADPIDRAGLLTSTWLETNIAQHLWSKPLNGFSRPSGAEAAAPGSWNCDNLKLQYIRRKTELENRRSTVFVDDWTLTIDWKSMIVLSSHEVAWMRVLHQSSLDPTTRV